MIRSLATDRTRGVAKLGLRGRLVCGLSCAALVSSALALSPARSFAADGEALSAPISVAQPEPGSAFDQWGIKMVTAGDLNGDGVNDVFVSDPKGVRALDGAALGRHQTKVLYTIAPPPGSGFRFATRGVLSVLGDVNGDGIPDLAVGSERANKVWIFSGKDGHLLFAIGDPHPARFDRFGGRVGTAGDVERDGVPDLIVGASGSSMPTGCADTFPTPAGCTPNQGRAYIFDGADGHLIRTLDVPPEDVAAGACRGQGCQFGLSVQGPGDVDGDGVPDQLVDAGYANDQRGRMYVFSGADGHLIRKIDSPEPQVEAFFGFQEVSPRSPGDVNGDGYADIYGASTDQNGPAGLSQGKAWVFDGRTGAVLYTINDPTPEFGGQFGWTMDHTFRELEKTNHEGDGALPSKRDADPGGHGLLLYIGQDPHHQRNPDGSLGGNGGTAVFDGRDGTLVKALELPAALRQSNPAPAGGPLFQAGVNPGLGWSLAAPGDLNGDGKPDFLAGAPFENISNGQGPPCQTPGIVDRDNPGCNVAQGLVLAFLSDESD